MAHDLTTRGARNPRRPYVSFTRRDAHGPHLGQGRTPAPGLVLTAALLGFFLITLDATVVNVALPAVGRDLHGGLSGLQWVVDGYTLPFAALMLSTGALSDRIGAGRAFAGGTALFTAASVACGLSPSLAVLITARVVQGMAASVALPSSLALVRQAYPDAARRARAVSLWAAGGSLAVALGPVAGGALTTALSWRAVFFVNLPVGAAALAIALRTGRSEPRPAPLDVAGQITAVAALAGLTFAVIEGGGAGLAALAVTAVAVPVFVAVELRHPHPVLPLSLFRNAVVTVSVAVGSAFSFAFYGVVFLFSLYFQEVRGQSALVAGLMFVPMTGLISVVNIAAGRITTTYGPKPPMVVGHVLMLGGLAAMLPVGAHTPLGWVAVAMVPMSLGCALAVPPLTAAMLEAVPPERAGLAAGVLNAWRQVGGALSVAVFGTLIADRSHFLPGLRAALLISAALLVVTGTATVLRLPRRRAAP